MAGEITVEYHAILKAALRLSPAEQLHLAKELVAGDHLVAFWEDWQHRLSDQGQVASEAEIDAIVIQVRAERQRGKR